MKSSIPKDLQNLGALTREWAESDKAYKLLDSDPETSGGSWLAGGCLVLAAAIVAWSQLRLTLSRVIGANGTEHYAATDGVRFFDADGVSTRRQIENRWRKVELVEGAKVFVDNVIDTRGGQIPIPPKLVRKVVLRLRQALGPVGGYASLRDLPSYDRLRGR